MTSIKQFIYLLRLSHWSKAAFVLLGVVYSGSMNYLPDALLAALAFCLIASAVYIYNDIQDREKDRLHPQKCRRPLASGEVSIDFAVSMLALLLLGGMLLAWSISTVLAVILAAYLLINLAYNHLLKSVPVLDVVCIASGFMLRVLAGTIGIGLPISWWLTITATLVSLLIALCKRRLEKQLGLRYETRLVLKRYTLPTLDRLIAVTACGCFIAYLFYTLIAHEESSYFLLTLPFAAIGLWRFARLSMRDGNNDDPVSLFFKDNLSRFNLLCFLVLTLVALVNDL
ncbi:phosphoribose diphosphate:decaprenyl-phosphate phosphoribosyltransferase [Legionella birminghamensis]|uniref:4-hydroxybenzoate octaprenyltransferase n=1 Tax=Legionella birminghamensis TaxID=28083 RepID=A0A378IB63_9GAMM|nr:decaprenyl-phosphate phosphoribosyltransferase [Legionella birminghamensis]KTC67752.1 phosphoribose diphosphate:decaprenyl-phosphate phosphoribosyltransferase [Legionella birminghamensis]STX32015.1 4-hydroxybenzoate octaprenyltransferase [Legionella birminghamensis]